MTINRNSIFNDFETPVGFVDSSGVWSSDNANSNDSDSITEYQWLDEPIEQKRMAKNYSYDSNDTSPGEAGEDKRFINNTTSEGIYSNYTPEVEGEVGGEV